MSDSELVAHYGKVMATLLHRKIVRSGNNPIADMAERVVADYYGVAPAPPNVKSYDVKTSDGRKIQVKALRRTKSSRSTLSALRTLDFDELAAVIFALDMTLVEMVLVPIDAVKDHMRWSNTWRANSLSVTQKFLADQRVIRIPAAEIVNA